MIRTILSLIVAVPMLIIVGYGLLWTKLTLWPIVVAYGHLVPWIFGACVAIWVLTSVLTGPDDDSHPQEPNRP